MTRPPARRADVEPSKWPVGWQGAVYVQMRRLLDEYRLFFKEFRRTFHTTGAVLPSSPLLGRALARYVADRGSPDSPGGRRILEVGPGTGAVTRQIARGMTAKDRLDLVELNERFVQLLQRRFQQDPQLQPVASQATIMHLPLQDLDVAEPYDLIVSGLPLNNFSAHDVQMLLAAFQRLLRPGGTLSFFQYIAVRPLRRLWANREEKQRLGRISQVLCEWLGQHEIQRQAIWINMPPAWVHHLQFAQQKQPQHIEAHQITQTANDPAE
ncbi:MAG: methyltransferase domain-containing protein [Planctomycetales bacterium]|nr:methyltransferase domain-containing protein [Planctomycetales bacterium]NIM07977.1 methyltransferase domain-containing protein [Planctomycetales bacterium]NIN07455.1 methyltransferase domain-containing protein [Planctomycetales bacterium]NIN76561.1 methyltransferase domain-containing protein [Planctomycetales bacterium]NIO33749.1 methyltransferase domain-containing protein [Planctomycetales bacterium]